MQLNSCLRRHLPKAALAILLAASAGAQASWTPWSKASAVYTSGLPVAGGTAEPSDISPDFSGPFVWYCGDAGHCPDSLANQVQFHYRFDTRDWDPLAVDIHSLDYRLIQADDFFAVYINGQLVPEGFGWLDDTPARADGLHDPVELSRSAADLVKLGINDIDIIACDGSPASPRVAPGATLDQGLRSCMNAQDRVNKYLLFQLDVVLNSIDPSVPGGANTITHHMIQADTTWDARAIPEPGSAPLLAAAAAAWWATQRRRARPAAR